MPRWDGVPLVEEDMPVVCAWHPTARAVLLWNLTEQRQDLTLRDRDRRRTIRVDALDSALIGDVGA